jgi:hypothetical protein
MASESNIVNISGVMTRDEIVARAKQKYAAERFDVPDWGPVELRRLKAIEQEEVFQFQENDPKLSVFRYNAKVASLGLVNPAMTYEEALEMTEDWLREVAGRIGEKTTENRKVAAEKAADGPRPFIATSSAATDSPSSSAEPPKKLAR